jgi:hypothetical protein
MLTLPTLGQGIEILRNADEGIALELDAFHGRGLWSPEGEAARLLGQNNVLAHVMHDADGRPVLMFGATLVRLGVAQTWFAGARGWQAVNRELVPLHARLVAIALEGVVHRVQIYSLAGRPRVREWFASLGYTLEGQQRAAGVQGEDVDLYGITKGEG